MANLDNFLLFDVAEVIISDKSDGTQFLYSNLTTSGISQTSSETEIRGGRGSALLALIESEKSIDITISNATVSKHWLEMQQGTEFKDSTDIIITQTESLPVTVDSSDPLTPVYSVKLTGTPIENGKISAINCNGERADNLTLLVDGTMELAEDFAKEGEKITVIYKAKVEGEVLEIDSAIFPKGWELQLEVPAMDKCTQKVTHKIVYVFDNVRPSSSFDLSFAMGEAITPEMTLKIMKSCCGTGLGRMAIVPIA